jgi:AAA domain, putative AbiEii toxin, Type IV TA system
MLKTIEVRGVGPVENLSAKFAARLNVLTGDNGLGKSFLLDVAFWALTGSWPGNRVALPEPENRSIAQGGDVTITVRPLGGRSYSPTIAYETSGRKPRAKELELARFEFTSQTWARPSAHPNSPGLVVYGAVDGSFSVWDPLRYVDLPSVAKRSGVRDRKSGRFLWQVEPRPYQFTSQTLADGLHEDGRTLCNGLIIDWATWYYQRSRDLTFDPFGLLESVISSLCHPQEQMKPGAPEKVFLNDTRLYPTIEFDYGTVAFPHWAAGVKRVVSLAYLLVWAWSEHLQASKLKREKPADHLILILDEIESHLHPKWQRAILPALLGVAERLKSDLKIQILTATHSPLILASLEPHFRQEDDRLFWFDLKDRTVSFHEYPWAIQGDVVAWLTSPIFGLTEARSPEAETVISAAEAFMAGQNGDQPLGLRTLEAIQKEMSRVLPGDDPIWSRWLLKTQGGLPK